MPANVGVVGADHFPFFRHLVRLAQSLRESIGLPAHDRGMAWVSFAQRLAEWRTLDGLWYVPGYLPLWTLFFVIICPWNFLAFL